MLESYLNQSCTINHNNGTDPRGQPVYSKPVEVPCRLVEKYQLIQTANGETVPVNHICYLTEKIAVGDTVNGLTVHAVDNWIDLNGDIIGYKAVM